MTANLIINNLIIVHVSNYDQTRPFPASYSLAGGNYKGNKIMGRCNKVP